MNTINCRNKGIDLEGQYTIESHRKLLVIEMVSPYPGITYSHIELRRNFDEYIGCYGEDIARKGLIKIFDAVNSVKANFNVYSGYLLEYDRLCSDKIKSHDKNEKILDESLAFVRDVNHKIMASSLKESLNADELLTIDAVNSNTLIDIGDIDCNLRKRFFEENGIKDNLPHSLILSIFNYLKVADSSKNTNN